MALKHDLSANPYFRRLTSNPPSLEKFFNSQAPFIHAVAHWSGIITKLMYRIIQECPQRTDLLKALIHNIEDEVSEGQYYGFHIMTFHAFLRRLGVPYDPLNIDVVPIVVSFNRTLDRMLTNSSISFILGALGGIEKSYVTASRIIHTFTNQATREIVHDHYATHSIVDVRHADQLLECPVDSMEQKQAGYSFGQGLLWELYEDLAKLLD